MSGLPAVSTSSGKGFLWKNPEHTRDIGIALIDYRDSVLNTYKTLCVVTLVQWTVYGLEVGPKVWFAIFLTVCFAGVYPNRLADLKSMVFQALTVLLSSYFVLTPSISAWRNTGRLVALLLNVSVLLILFSRIKQNMTGIILPFYCLVLVSIRALLTSCFLLQGYNRGFWLLCILHLYICDQLYLSFKAARKLEIFVKNLVSPNSR